MVVQRSNTGGSASIRGTVVDVELVVTVDVAADGALLGGASDVVAPSTAVVVASVPPPHAASAHIAATAATRRTRRWGTITSRGYLRPEPLGATVGHRMAPRRLQYCALMISITTRQLRFTSIAADVLIFVTILNLFVEYSYAIEIDSFTISILTAVVLKLLLDGITAAEHAVAEYLSARDRPLSKVLRVFAVWLILFLSKFMILEVVDFVFGDHVELGGFVEVTLLIIVMIVVQRLVYRFYWALGDDSVSTAE